VAVCHNKHQHLHIFPSHVLQQLDVRTPIISFHRQSASQLKHIATDHADHCGCIWLLIFIHTNHSSWHLNSNRSMLNGKLINITNDYLRKENTHIILKDHALILTVFHKFRNTSISYCEFEGCLCCKVYGGWQAR